MTKDTHQVLQALARSQKAAIYTVRITMPYGPTQEYTRLLEPDALDSDASMQFYEEDARASLRKAFKDIGPFPAPGADA